MTDLANPWSTLAPGQIDARRVNPDGKHDFFWVISGRGEPGLLLKVDKVPHMDQKLPKMRNLELEIRQVAGAAAFVVFLKDAEQRELFTTLCEDVIRAGESAMDSTDALQRAVRRTLRWHHLLRGGLNGLLSLEEQRGLVGELHFLQRLVQIVGPRAAIEAWKGPSGSSKDFELDGCLCEVKARRGAAKPFVQISSEDQLSDVDGCRVFLVVTAVDAAVKPQGKSLTDYALAMESVFVEAGSEAFGLWETALAETGFDFTDDYSERRWTVGKTQDFSVEGSFPRIAAPLTAGVSGVRYSIALDACQPFALDAGVLEAIALEGVEQWTS